VTADGLRVELPPSPRGDPVVVALGHVAVHGHA
jgi:hypothetical protein